MIYVPYADYLRVPYIEHPTLGWASFMASLQPVVWLRLNTASGTENNLGSGGGTVQFGGGVTRSATGGPVAGSGYATTTATGSFDMYIHSQVSTMWTTFTVGAWIKLPASGNGGGNTVFSKREYFASATNAFPYAMLWDQTNTRMQVSLDSGSDFSADQAFNTANGSIPTAQWVFLVNVVRPSGSAVEIFTNGSLLYSTSATCTVATGSAIPKWGIAQSNEYSGGIGQSDCAGDWSEFFVINRALTSAEVAALYGARNVP
jgi:hypothetical protein